MATDEAEDFKAFVEYAKQVSLYMNEHTSYREIIEEAVEFGVSLDAVFTGTADLIVRSERLGLGVEQAAQDIVTSLAGAIRTLKALVGYVPDNERRH